MLPLLFFFFIGTSIAVPFNSLPPNHASTKSGIDSRSMPSANILYMSWPPSVSEQVATSISNPWKHSLSGEQRSLLFLPCIERMSLPCSIGDKSYVASSSFGNAALLSMGTYGSIFAAHQVLPDGTVNVSKTFAIKFAVNDEQDACGTPLAKEDVVSIALWRDVQDRDYWKQNIMIPHWMSEHDINTNVPPIAAVYAGENRVNQPMDIEHAESQAEKTKVVLVMDYYKLGSVHYLSGDVLLAFRQNPEGYVWKYLLDVSFISSVMNQRFHWFDPDIKLKNILISGDYRHYKTTSFVKIDNGMTMTKRGILTQLNTRPRTSWFCHCGTSITPVDVTILYYRKKSNKMAAKFSDELESKGILGVAASALGLYNKLVAKQARIELRALPETHDIEHRIQLIRENWRRLNTYYNESKYYDPQIPPANIRDLLVKLYWMSYQLADEMFVSDVDSAPYLKWNVLLGWLRYDVWDLDQFRRMDNITQKETQMISTRIERQQLLSAHSAGSQLKP